MPATPAGYIVKFALLTRDHALLSLPIPVEKRLIAGSVLYETLMPVMTAGAPMRCHCLYCISSKRRG